MQAPSASLGRPLSIPGRAWVVPGGRWRDPEGSLGESGVPWGYVEGSLVFLEVAGGSVGKAALTAGMAKAVGTAGAGVAGKGIFFCKKTITHIFLYAFKWMHCYTCMCGCRLGSADVVSIV